MFDQLAIRVTEDKLEGLAEYYALQGLEVSEDTVTAYGDVGNQEGVIVQFRLLFVYGLFPFELEFICSKSDSYLREAKITTGAVAHFGQHVDDFENILSKTAKSDIIQHVVTLSHSNPAIKDTRRYEYLIVRDGIGVCKKYIRRIILDAQGTDTGSGSERKIIRGSGALDVVSGTDRSPGNA